MSFTAAQIAFLDANSDSIEARRTFEVGFASGTVRLIEGSTPWPDGSNTWLAAHGVIQAAGIRASGVMDAHPAQYRFGMVSPELSLAHMNDEAEWRDAVIHQRLVLFVDGEAVGPAIHIHRGKISDIRRIETVRDDYFSITAEGPFQDRNSTLLGKYTDRDQRMRSPGDKGCEYAAQYEVSGAEFTGWLTQ
ncbi:MAG: hypothetical protein MEQ74_03970 [Paracoccus sp.]|nr:hypothetical protein [Paracoccus sp. (in: a-proteobacteria)]